MKMDKPKILVIDDSKFVREVTETFLNKMGFHIIALESGERCMETIDAEKPAIILLDIVLPGISGNEVLLQIRQKFSQIQLPVIMVTSKSDAVDVVESLSIGANDYISKPVNYDIATRRIRTQLEMAALSRKMADLKELEAIHAMITTYNHEINNPLTIAIGRAEQIMRKYPDEPGIQALCDALWRIAEIVKKTLAVAHQGSVEYSAYSGSMKMLKLK